MWENLVLSEMLQILNGKLSRVNTHFLYDEVCSTMCVNGTLLEKVHLACPGEVSGFMSWSNWDNLRWMFIFEKKAIWPWRWHFLHRTPHLIVLGSAGHLFCNFSTVHPMNSKAACLDLSVWEWMYSNKTLFAKHRWQASFHWCCLPTLLQRKI